MELMLNASGLKIKQQIMLMTLYARGMRVEEVCRLKLPDVQSRWRQIHVEQNDGKGERYAPLLHELLEYLRNYWRLFRRRGQPTGLKK